MPTSCCRRWCPYGDAGPTTRRLSLNEEESHSVYRDPRTRMETSRFSTDDPDGRGLRTRRSAARYRGPEWRNGRRPEVGRCITENPGTGDTEVWEIYNFTADAHPIHIHLVQFQVMTGRSLSLTEKTVPPAGDSYCLAPSRLPRPGRPASRTRSSPIRARSPASRRGSTARASLSGTATSSSTRTTR